MIDELCDGPCEEDTIAMFYCDFRDQQRQTATSIIGAILKQLLLRGGVLEDGQSAFQKAKKEVSRSATSGYGADVEASYCRITPGVYMY